MDPEKNLTPRQAYQTLISTWNIAPSMAKQMLGETLIYNYCSWEGVHVGMVAVPTGGVRFDITEKMM